MFKKMLREQLKLYLVTDRKLARDRNFDEIILEAVRGGVTIVQLREKNLDARRYLEKALNLKNRLDECKVPFIINDRVDVAFASGASGVHVGQSDLPITHARRILGKNKIIGLSTNTVKQAIEAEKLGADYIAISPVFSTPTKTDIDPPVGIEGIPRFKKVVKIPIIGIGGINKNNARAVIRAGCDGIAVVSAIMASENPKEAAAELIREIEKGFND
ncbi:MAG: thiamine phosphate synthase [Candidatus Helarchaeota archaeon]